MRDRNGGTELDTIPSGYHVNVTESRDVAESRQEWPLMVVRVVVPITDEGMVDGRWGRAERVAVAEVNNGTINNWCEFDVAWEPIAVVFTNSEAANSEHLVTDAQIEEAVSNGDAVEIELPSATFHCAAVSRALWEQGTPVTP